jgi:hypothetical protein
MKSTEKLVFALREANAPADMIARAEADYYHDFKSPLATPCIQLATDLAQALLANMGNAKLETVRRQAMDGVFDADREESDEWAASPEGQATIRELIGSPPPRPAGRRGRR